MREDWHLDEGTALGLVTGRLDVRERNQAVRHLLAGCESCREMVRQISFASEGMEGVGAELFDQLGEMSLMTSQIIRTLDDAMGRLLWADIERIPFSRLAVGSGVSFEVRIIELGVIRHQYCRAVVGRGLRHLLG